MSSKQRIAELAAFLTADITDYQAKMKTAASVTTSTSSAISNTLGKLTTAGANIGVGMLSGFAIMSAGLRGVVREIERVIDNIQDIPGISPEVLSNIQEARVGFMQTRQALDANIASTISWGLQFKKTAAAVWGFINSDKDPSSPLVPTQEQLDKLVPMKVETPDQLSQSKNPQFWDELTKAKEAYTLATRDASKADLDEAGTIDFLEAESGRYLTHAASAMSGADSIRILQDKTDAVKDTTEATKLWDNMNKEAILTEKELDDALDKNAIHSQTLGDGIKDLTAKYASLSAQKDAVLANTSASVGDLTTSDGTTFTGFTTPGPWNPKDVANLKQIIDLNKQMTQVQKDLNPLLQKQRELYMSIGNDVASSFQSAVFSGKNLHDTLTGLLLDLAKIAFEQTITKPLGTYLGGTVVPAIGGFISGLFAAGGRPTPGQAAVIGEKGPELWVPDSAGTIIPNHMLASGGGNTYQIDARGADVGAVSRISAALYQLAGPGVTELRSLSAVNNHVKRGGVLGR